MLIKNKREMYRLLMQGSLGNTIRMWGSVAELQASGFVGRVTIRSLTVSDPLRIYNSFVGIALRKLDSLGFLDRTDLIIGVAPPDGQRILQGEVSLISHEYVPGLHLRYNRLELPMRVAFERENLHSHGLLALNLLKVSVCPPDLDDFNELFNTYPGCTIEFSSYECGVGLNPSRNTIVWEVRNY